MIRMSRISKSYRSGLVAMEALIDFSLSVERGEFVSVMGPSGSGKTTFLNIAGLLDGFDGGEYTLDDVNVSGLGDDALSQLRNEKIGFVFQSFNLIPDLTVFDNIELPLRYRGLSGRERRERVLEILERVGMTARRSHYPAQLSGGQQQRVAVARALVGRPALILADEPTGNLDSLMAHQMIDLLERINAEGTTVIMVTHASELAARAQRRLHVLDGKVIDTQARQRAAHEALTASRG